MTPHGSTDRSRTDAGVALRCRGVNVSLGGNEIIRGIDLDVAAGQWLSIIGPNGAGKSTLLRALSGTVSAQGSIEVFGTELASMERNAVARTIAWVAQQPLLPPAMRVIDYVLLGRTPYRSLLGGASASDVGIARAVIDNLDLGTLADRAVDTLSGGERQRVLIARALAQQTPIVLLDEPTTALDLGHQQEVLDLLDSLRAEHQLTIVSTMHDLSLAGQYANTLVLLDNGTVQKSGTADEVLNAELLRQHFGASVAVLRDDDGIVIVVPKRQRRSSLPKEPV